MNRYDPLRWHLAKVPADQHEVRFSFRDIEKIVGPFPPSARNRRQWWENSESHVQAAAWQGAGFKVTEVNLTTELVVFGRGTPQRRSLGASVVTTTVGDSHHASNAAYTTADDNDHTEARVQARLVSSLTRHQWHIHRVADTATREHGIDVLATKAGRTLAIEVKGYPGRFYSDPRRADKIKPTSPSVQARHLFAEALLKAMITRDEYPEYEIAIAFPDVPTYRSLLHRTRASLADLAIIALLVAADGTVTRFANEGNTDPHL